MTDQSSVVLTYTERLRTGGGTGRRLNEVGNLEKRLRPSSDAGDIVLVSTKVCDSTPVFLMRVEAQIILDDCATRRRIPVSEVSWDVAIADALDRAS
jgi:hypothetical protein